MSKKLKLMLFLVVVVMIVPTVAACGPRVQEPEWVLVWEEDFETSTDWKGSPDGSVGCTNVEVTKDDLNFGVVNIVTPTGDNSALQLESNTNRRPSVFMNAIADPEYKETPFLPRARYKLTAWMAIPKDAEVHLANLAFNFVSEEMGHSAEVFLGADDSSLDSKKYYGWINVRDGNYHHRKLLDLTETLHQWHYIELVVTVMEPEDIYTIDWIRVDDELFVLGYDMPEFAKPDWPRTAQVYLETHNQEGCHNGNTSMGVTQWDEVKLYASVIRVAEDQNP